MGLSPREMAVILYGESYSAPPPSPEEAQRRTANRENAMRIGSARPGFDPELQRELSKVQAPTLVLWGTEDKMILPGQARHFVEAIPNARLVTIDGAPHVLSAAVPEAFLEAVLGFLSQTEATSSAVA